MKKTCAFAFYARASKSDKKGLSHIEVSISIDGKRTFIMLPFKCKAADFQRKKQPKQIQDYLSIMTCKINRYIVDMAQRGIPLTANNLSQIIRDDGISANEQTVKDLFDSYNQIIQGRDISHTQILKYQYTTDIFFMLVGAKTPLSKLSNADLLKFKNYVYNKYQVSTAAGYMTRIKSYMRFARDNGMLLTDLGADVRTIRPQRKDILYLSNEEYEALKNKDMHSPRLNQVRDLWIFQANSGLSYCDMAALRQEDIQCIDDVYYIAKERGKTGVQFIAVILPDGLDILRRYNYQLPVLSNQRYNSYLAECLVLAQVEKHITTHTARHQYATRLLAAGVPITTIQRALGHSSVKMTESFYAALSKETILKEVSSALY